MPSEEAEGASPPWGSHPWGKGTLGTWRAHRQHGGRARTGHQPSQGVTQICWCCVVLFRGIR